MRLRQLCGWDSITVSFQKQCGLNFGPLPADLNAVTITDSGAGNTGDVRWAFTGTLAPRHQRHIHRYIAQLTRQPDWRTASAIPPFKNAGLFHACHRQSLRTVLALCVADTSSETLLVVNCQA
jgi:hypothetical protein